MIIYIDSDCKCYTTNPDGLFREFEIDFFNNKCQTFIEGYRFVPKDEKWKREDGRIFLGEMIAPYKSYPDLDNAQRDYEKQKLAEYDQVLQELGVEV